MDYSVKIASDGSLPLPDELRRELDLRGGDTVTLACDHGALRVVDREAGVRRFQAMVRSFLPEGAARVDAMIAERTRERADQRT